MGTASNFSFRLLVTVPFEAVWLNVIPIQGQDVKREVQSLQGPRYMLLMRDTVGDSQALRLFLAPRRE